MSKNILEDLQMAIVSKYVANTWLNTNTHGLYFYRAGKQVAFPYVVFTLEASYDQFAIGNSKRIRLQFNVFSKSDSTKELNDILLNLKTEYEDASLTLTDYTLCTKPQIDVESGPFINDSDVWQGTLIFRLQVQ